MELEEYFALLRECFAVVALARAAGERHMEAAWFAVGMEWWLAERPRWPLVSPEAC